MTAYVAGFAFDTLCRVYLVRKIKPAWQNGLLNGIGGKIEEGETPDQAMAREFHEEAGVLIAHDRWLKYHRESWMNGNSVDFFAVDLQADEQPTTCTDEVIETLSWRGINSLEWSMHRVMYNLPYLIPMAYIHLHHRPANLYYHKEPK